MSMTEKDKPKTGIEEEVSLGDFWQEALDGLVRETSSSFAYIVSRDKGNLSVVKSSSNETEKDEEFNSSLQKIFDGLITSEKTLIYPDDDNGNGMIFKKSGISSFLGIPIFRPNGDIYGALGIINKKTKSMEKNSRQQALDFCRTFEDQLLVARKRISEPADEVPADPKDREIEKLKKENVKLTNLINHICEETKKSVKLIKSFVRLGIDKPDMIEVINQKIINEADKLYHVEEIPQDNKNPLIFKDNLPGSKEVMFEILSLPDTVVEVDEEKKPEGYHSKKIGSKNLPDTELDVDESSDRIKYESSAHSRRQAVRSLISGDNTESVGKYKMEGSRLSYVNDMIRREPSREFPKVCPHCNNANRQIAKFCADCGCSFEEQRARLMKRGRKEFDTKNLEKALKYYDKILTFEPDDEEAVFSEAICLVNLRKNEEAVSCFNRALKLNPYNVEALSKKGQMLMELGRYAEAIRCFDRILKIEPNNRKARTDLAMAVAKVGARKRKA